MTCNLPSIAAISMVSNRISDRLVGYYGLRDGSSDAISVE